MKHLYLLLLLSLSACIVQGNRPPSVELESSRNVDLFEVVYLEGEVADDGLPQDTLLVTWNKLRGPGEVIFSDPRSAVTTATFSEPGTYVLRLTTDDTELTSTAEVTLNILQEGRSPVTALTQAGYFATGYEGGGAGGVPLLIPSIDPAGVAFHLPTGHLFIADSEIDEVDKVFNRVQSNIFEVSPSGGVLYNSWDITKNDEGDNKEPAGITYCANDGHFYISNDSKQTIYRHAFNGMKLEIVDQIITSPYSEDPEGIACDPDTGYLYVIGGSGINVAVYSYHGGFQIEREIDLTQTAGAPEGIPSDPEGITFDSVSRRLFIVSAPDQAVFEYTTSGVFTNKFSIADFAPRPVTPQGLTIGPSTTDPRSTSLYIADGGRDNNKYPSERDGAIYEARMTRANE